MSKALAKSSTAVATRKVTRYLDRIANRALSDVAAMYLPKDDPNRNPDADVPLAEASTRTRFGMRVYEQVMQTERNTTNAQVALGVVAMQARMSKEKWEAEAKKVDAEARGEVVDVEAEPAK